MSNKNAVNSLSLFKRFQPKFREIEWHPHERGVLHLNERGPLYDTMYKELFPLSPGYLGSGEIIPNTECTDGGSRSNVWWTQLTPSFNIREGLLRFGFVFDPESKEEIEEQVGRAIVKALYDGPFKGRRFFMDPVYKKHGDTIGRDLWVHGTKVCLDSELDGMIVEFSIDDSDNPIHGLDFGQAVMASKWHFFIPDGPERRAIQAAIDLEAAMVEQQKHHEQDPHKFTVRALQEKLQESMNCFAA